MITTLQALLVALLALLPGASYTFAFERVAGAYGITLSDRIFRFLAASAVLGAVASGPVLVLFRRWIVTGRLDRGEVAALSLELAAISYVAVPIALGSAVGVGVKRRWKWLRVFIDTDEHGRRSYAAGYPEPSDIFLSTQLKIDGEDGYLELDAQGSPLPVEGRSGLLLRWDEVEYLELEEF